MGDVKNPVFTLSLSDLKECADFAEKAADNHSPFRFGEKDSKRSHDQVVNDIFTGKMGEVAFAKWLTQQKAKHGDFSAVRPDFTIRPLGEVDEQDFLYKGWKFDVKCTGQRNYFRIGLNSLKYRGKVDQLPHFYVIAKLAPGLSYDAYKQDAELPGAMRQVQLAGFMPLEALQVGGAVRIIVKGDMDPDTWQPSASTFLEVRMNDLAISWEELWNSIQGTAPETQMPEGASQANMLQYEAEEEEGFKAARYSILLTGDRAELYRSRIESALKRGIKVILFSTLDDCRKYEDLEKSCPYFELYSCEDDLAPLMLPVFIVDGEMDDSQEDLLRTFFVEHYTRYNGKSHFNLEQFEVEHEKPNAHIVVRASAGTGKTTVMIDRIMYLLTMENVKTADIGMITFTNEAASHMLVKLQEKITGYYNYTRNLKYLELLEQLADMRISTIDSFFKQIVTEEGAHLGYAHSIRVRSFIMERNQIIHDALDVIFNRMREQEGEIPYMPSLFHYEKIVRKIWETLSSRGYFPVNPEDLDAGSADSEEDRRMNDILKEAVLLSARAYEERKKELDALDIGDIKEEMNKLVGSGISHFQDLSLKYLFVDEFQDTDNSQIQSIVWLVKQLGCYLLAVGDVKQSIYRFRGASDTAFQELEKGMKACGASVKEHSLRINYRSDPRILEELNRYFSKWNENGYLSYAAKDHVEAGIGPFYSVEKPVNVFESSDDDEREKQFAEDVKQLREERPGDSICVLCRNNYDVTRCAAVLRAHDINCHAKLRGGFYSTPPVNDLYALLGALLYPTDPVRLFNFLLSSYSDAPALDGEELSGKAGKTEEILSYLEGVRDQKQPDEWKRVMQAVQVLPAFDFLREYCRMHDPVAGYFHHVVGPGKGSKEEKQYKLEQYQLNLDKLFRVLYEHFAGDFPTLDAIYSYLTILRTTGDTTEDALYPSDDQTEAVLVMTVHKAKGLEFDHVFLPCTGNHFYRKDTVRKGHGLEVLTEGSGLPVKLGWHFYMTVGKESRPTLRIYENRYYREMQSMEKSALLGEETRVLYVALTRACQSLHIYKKPAGEETIRSGGPGTWNGLLDEGEELDGE